MRRLLPLLTLRPLVLPCAKAPEYMDPVTKGCYDGDLIYSPTKRNAKCTGNHSFGLDAEWAEGVRHKWHSRGESWVCNPPPLEVDGHVMNYSCKSEMDCKDPSFKCGPPNAKSEDKYCWDLWDGWSANLQARASPHENVQRHRGDDLVLWPDGADCDTPRILFIHGGAWISGGPNQSHYSVHASKISKLTGFVVMLVDYPLAPMGNYRTILSWSEKAWKWLSWHGPSARPCKGRAPPILLAGDSSGGGTAFSLMLRLLSRDPPPGPKPAGFVGESPWLNLACDTPSYYSNAFANITNSDGTVSYIGDVFYQAPPGDNTKSFAGSPDPGPASAGTSACYCAGTCGGDGYDFQDVYASPYWATDDMLSILPPLYFVVSSTETVGGDSEVLAKRAATLGAVVVLDQYAGMWHTFPQWSEGRCNEGGDAPLWQGQAALGRMSSFMKEVAAARVKCRGQYKNGISQPQTLTHLLHPVDASNSLATIGPLELNLCRDRVPPSRLYEQWGRAVEAPSQLGLVLTTACVTAASTLVLAAGALRVARALRPGDGFVRLPSDA